MLLEYIARYYKFLWLLFAAIVLLKIILSYSFHKNLTGVYGFLYAIFKWYGNEEQDVEDDIPRRTIMHLHNIVTIGIYFSLSLILVATIIPRVFAR